MCLTAEFKSYLSKTLSGICHQPSNNRFVGSSPSPPSPPWKKTSRYGEYDAFSTAHHPSRHSDGLFCSYRIHSIKQPYHTSILTGEGVGAGTAGWTPRTHPLQAWGQSRGFVASSTTYTQLDYTNSKHLSSKNKCNIPLHRVTGLSISHVGERFLEVNDSIIMVSLCFYSNSDAIFITHL